MAFTRRAALALLACVSLATASQVVLPATCLSSQANFDKYFSYDYPWGNTHNGAAKMDKSHCSLSGGYLTETAVYSPGQAGGINYNACTVYAKQHFTVTAGGGYDFTADFIAPTAKGTWPALWLTAVTGWPPEIDIAEWKGDGKVSFNTFNTSSQVSAHDVTYSNPGAWHTVKCQIRAEPNGSDDFVIDFFLDGVHQITQHARDYVGKAFWLIIDLQMEGSSGSPGPHTDTKFSVRNLQATSYN